MYGDASISNPDIISDRGSCRHLCIFMAVFLGQGWKGIGMMPQQAGRDVLFAVHAVNEAAHVESFGKNRPHESGRS
jgi:hypothetical protein